MKRIFILLLFGSFFCQAQSLHYAGIFPTIDHSGSVGKKLGYGLYYFGAFPMMNIKTPNSNRESGFLLFYSEQSLSYSASQQLSFTGAYVYQRANVMSSDYVNENRFYIQAKYKHSVNHITFSHRFRFDGRFIQNRADNNTLFTHRARYLIGMDLPIKTQKQNLYLTAYEEIFFNTFRGAGPVYAENWTYAAAGLKLNERNKLEAGLLYITWNLTGANWFNQYYLQLSWVSHLDLKKKKEAQ